MKRYISVILAVCLIFGLAACEGGSGKRNSQPGGLYKTDKKSGEVIVDGVDFANYKAAGDDARVFYEIFVGSFSDSNGDGIGDLRGIINRMDYLNDGDPKSGKSLGIEGIWLTPIFSSPSYHKYNTTDYLTIDPQFGTMEDLKELIELCHTRGVKIILDFVINHTSRSCEWFKKFALAHQKNDTADPYYNFYTFIRWGEAKPAGRTFSQIPGSSDLVESNFDSDMPELNYSNIKVRQTILDIAQFYLDMGVDGFRFDAAKYVYFNDHTASVNFWRSFLYEMKMIKPDIYTVAEVWDSDLVTNRYFEVVNCFNFTLSQQNGMYSDVAKAGNANRLTSYVESYLKTVTEKNSSAMLVPFIANHDTDRAAGFLTPESGNMQFAANLYILGPGSPFIYYGEELGMRGSRGSANTDANRRLAMVWGDDDTVKDPEGSTYNPDNQIQQGAAAQLCDDSSLLTYYKKLLMIRAANPEIARGEYKALSLTDTKVGGFTSTWDGSTVCVLHNPSNSAAEIDLSKVQGAEGFKTVSAFIGGAEEAARLEGTTLTLGPKTSAVLR